MASTKILSVQSSRVKSYNPDEFSVLKDFIFSSIHSVCVTKNVTEF